MRLESGVSWFPYVPPSWLQTLVELVRRSVPQRIDQEWCLTANRFSFTKNNASQFVSQIRTIGWTDEDGNISELGRNLRLSGQPYQELMRKEVARIYNELEPQLGQADFDRDALETYFTAASSLGQSGRRQIISAFRWFLGQAGFSDVLERLGGQAQLADGRRQRHTGAAPRQPRTRPRVPRGSAVDEEQQQLSSVPMDSGIPITLSISLNLPATADEQVYEAIFRAMSRHLFGRAES